MPREAPIARALDGPSIDFAPQLYARIGGMLYLLIIAAGAFAEVAVRDRLIVPRDAAATARNITAHPLLFRIGVAADLSTFLTAVALTMILFVLFKPVSRQATLLMLMFNLVQDAVGGLNALNTYQPLQLLGGADYLKVFSRQQLEALALSALNAHSVGFDVALMFFGFSCVALGYLIFRSGFLPKALGLLMSLAGISYLINSSARIVSPRLASILFPSILLPALIGELSFALWLTLKGIDTAKWQEQAGPLS